VLENNLVQQEEVERLELALITNNFVNADKVKRQDFLKLI